VVVVRKILYCEKRDGQRVLFEKTKIVNAIYKAFEVSQEGNKIIAQKMTETIMENILRIHRDNTPTIEDIQDLVEDTLISHNFRTTAKNYIRYRYERAKVRGIS
jgi:anaerobic ribonucleoside-triphosphate reductase